MKRGGEAVVELATDETDPQSNLQRLLSHLPAHGLAAKLVVASEAESDDALKKLLDARLDELRRSYDPPPDKKD